MITAVDQGSWITVSKISVLLKASTVMAAEVAGANILPDFLGLLFGQKMNVTMVTEPTGRKTDELMEEGDDAPLVKDEKPGTRMCLR